MWPGWAGSGSEPRGPQPAPWPPAAPGGAGRREEGGAVHRPYPQGQSVTSQIPATGAVFVFVYASKKQKTGGPPAGPHSVPPPAPRAPPKPMGRRPQHKPACRQTHPPGAPARAQAEKHGVVWPSMHPPPYALREGIPTLGHPSRTQVVGLARGSRITQPVSRGASQWS
jgi:hypothetical protein